MKINQKDLNRIILEEYKSLLKEGWIPDEFGHLPPERKRKIKISFGASVKPTATFKGKTVTYPSGEYEGLLQAIAAVNNGERPSVEDIKNNLEISEKEKFNLIKHMESTQRFLKKP